MRIPTLIGIALIIALLGSLGFWFFSREKNQTQTSFAVSNLEIANTSNSAITIVWQTNLPAVGQIHFGESENLNQKASDNRDYKTSTPRLTHFATLKNLKPNTRYLYKIVNDSGSYPLKALEFKTANAANLDDLNFSFIKPLKGTILNTNLNPIDESLIFLEIPGAQSLATFSSTAGNFILPLKLVLNKDLVQVFNIPPGTIAILTVRKGTLESKVKISISDSTVNLPPVTIGSNLDLTNYVKSPLTTITIGQGRKGTSDFNNDGKINSLDLAILRGKAGSRSTLSREDQIKFDINSDGIVDQNDIDVFSRSLVTN